MESSSMPTAAWSRMTAAPWRNTRQVDDDENCLAMVDLVGPNGTQPPDMGLGSVSLEIIDRWLHHMYVVVVIAERPRTYTVGFTVCSLFGPHTIIGNDSAIDSSL